MRLLPNAEALSEFQGYTGDCGEDADLAAEHLYNLSIADNAANLNAIVHFEIGAHEASATGSEPLSAIDQHLTDLKIPHTTWGYAEPFNQPWQAKLAAEAGINPLILEFANAQALPGDESGVHYHFATVVGIDDNGAYIVSDGDNVAAHTGGFGHYSLAQLEAAQPCGLIEVLMPVAAPVQPPQNPMPEATEYNIFAVINPNCWEVVSGGPCQGNKIQLGLLDAYKNWPAQGGAHGLTAFGLPLADEAPIPNHPGCAWQPFERGILIYDPSHEIDSPPGATGPVYVAHSNYRP